MSQFTFARRALCVRIKDTVKRLAENLLFNLNTYDLRYLDHCLSTAGQL